MCNKNVYGCLKAFQISCQKYISYSPKYFRLAVRKLINPLARFQGPVVQSIIGLTGSLRVISLTVLVDSIHNILIFFC